jgi:hypothetical protein
MKTYFYLSAFFILLVLTNCTNSERASFDNKVLSMMSQEENISVFGKINYNEILNKSEYKSIPNFGSIISSVVTEFSAQVNIDEPIYFSLIGPFSQEGKPNQSLAYISVKNADSLVGFLTEKGYDFNKKDEFYFSQIDDFVIGIKNDLAILINQTVFDNPEKLIESKFSFLDNTEINESYQKILETKDDIVIGYDVEKSFLSSNTSLSKLDQKLQDEVKEMVKDSYGQISIRFDAGKLVVKNKNYYSEALKQHFFFKEDASKSVLKELGQGEARMGLSVNMDVDKLQKFINKYAPDLMNQLAESIGGPFQMAMVMSGDSGLKGLISGKIGVLVFGEPNEYGSIEPSFNAYLGLGKQGVSLAQMGKSLIENGEMKVVINDKGLACYSSPKYTSNGGNLKLPLGCENFGKEAVSGFANFKDLDLNSFQLEGGAKLLQLVESVHFSMNVEGGEMVVLLKEKKINVLKQVVDFELKEFESQLSNLAF